MTEVMKILLDGVRQSKFKARPNLSFYQVVPTFFLFLFDHSGLQLCTPRASP